MRDFFTKRLSLAITLVMFVFGVMMATVLVAAVITFALQHLGIISNHSQLPVFPLITFLGFCILLGTSLTAFLSKKALNPIRTVIGNTPKC